MAIGVTVLPWSAALDNCHDDRTGWCHHNWDSCRVRQIIGLVTGYHYHITIRRRTKQKSGDSLFNLSPPFAIRLPPIRRALGGMDHLEGAQQREGDDRW